MIRPFGFFTGAAICLAASASLSQPAPPPPPVQRLYQQERIRVFYHIDGKHAVEAADGNGNDVPDQVEDLMTQTRAAQILFVEGMGFPDPFQTERFRTASFLDIHLRHKDLLKSNGITFDELQRFKRPSDPEGTLSICFNVATSVHASENLTPAHEFFHLIQNGTTYFKNRWFTEGTARWSEKALGSGDLGPVGLTGSWPLPADKAATIFSMSYDASEHFWNPLAARLDAVGRLPDGPALKRVQAMTYTDGTPVLKDLRLTGWEFVRDVVLALGKVDDEAFRELGYDRWSEVNQRSPKNDAFILRVIEAEVSKRD